jgi:hypothetical protein
MLVERPALALGRGRGHPSLRFPPREDVVARTNRRLFLLALPQGAVALTAACASGAARGAAPRPADVVPVGATGSETPSPDEPATHGPTATPRLVRPLPTMDDAALRQQWRDLMALPSAPGAVGC